MEHDPSYTLGDLARLADVTPRTIRYYVSQGLLPSPEAAGPATRYAHGHLARLRVIRRMQREHLPLAEIRARLDALSEADVLELANAEISSASPQETLSALDYIRTLMTKGQTPTTQYDRPAPVSPAPAALMREARAPYPSAPSLLSRISVPADAKATPSSRLATPDRSTWERTSLSPDVELHVRRPLDRETNKRVDRLLRIARDLFEDDA
jgi:DNA-binding transcriptional MerR regulator